MNANVGINTYGKRQWSERVFRVTYSYSLGSLKLTKYRQRKTGSEDELARIKN